MCISPNFGKHDRQGMVWKVWEFHTVVFHPVIAKLVACGTKTIGNTLRRKNNFCYCFSTYRLTMITFFTMIFFWLWLINLSGFASYTKHLSMWRRVEGWKILLHFFLKKPQCLLVDISIWSFSKNKHYIYIFK
jgi:hypothetical protein